MNVYDYIYSPDIREHCRKIRHRFTPLEQAAIVCRSELFSLREKQQAYRTLLEECEAEVPCDEESALRHTSLKTHLKRMISEIDDVYAWMKKPLSQSEAFGFVRPWSFKYIHELFPTIEKAVEYALECSKADDEEVYFEVGVFERDAPYEVEKSGVANQLLAYVQDAPCDVDKSLCFSPKGVPFGARGFEKCERMLIAPGSSVKVEKLHYDPSVERSVSLRPEHAFVSYPLPFEKGDIIERIVQGRQGITEIMEEVFESYADENSDETLDFLLPVAYALYVWPSSAEVERISKPPAICWDEIICASADHICYSKRSAAERPAVINALAGHIHSLPPDAPDISDLLVALRDFYTGKTDAKQSIQNKEMRSQI